MFRWAAARQSGSLLRSDRPAGGRGVDADFPARWHTVPSPPQQRVGALLLLAGLAAASTLPAERACAMEAKQPARSAPGKHAKAAPGSAAKAADGEGDSSKSGKAGTKPEKTAYDYTLPDARAVSIPISTYKGKVLFIVNLAHASSYNVQLAALQKLSETYKDKGLVVLGVPCNDFGASEPGTDAELMKFYSDAKVTFPIMQRSALIGVEELPLYGFLTKGKGGAPENVHWNFTKFLVDRKGSVVARFDPDVAPDSPELLSTLERVLNGTFEPHKEKPTGEAAADSDDDDD